MPVTLINATPDSLAVSWPATGGAKRYVLQYRSEDTEEYTTLSEHLAATEARNFFLREGCDVGFYFRAGAVMGDHEVVESWKTHSDPFHLLPTEEQKRRLPAPTVCLGGSYNSLLVSWAAPPSGERDVVYELQMREHVGGAVWATVANNLRGTEALKKNLPSKHGYQFRVRPFQEEKAPFSPPSDPVIPVGLSPGMKQWFKKCAVIRHVNKPIPLSEALGGKEFVLLFAGADWCKPCKKFMKMLDEWYQSLGPNKSVEVVYLSSDQDEVAFRFFFAQMPWLAVDYQQEKRRELMFSDANIKSIPSLVVLDGRSGEIIESDALEKTIDIERWRSIVAAQRE